MKYIFSRFIILILLSTTFVFNLNTATKNKISQNLRIFFVNILKIIRPSSPLQPFVGTAMDSGFKIEVYTVDSFYLVFFL